MAGLKSTVIEKNALTGLWWDCQVRGIKEFI